MGRGAAEMFKHPVTVNKRKIKIEKRWDRNLEYFWVGCPLMGRLYTYVATSFLKSTLAAIPGITSVKSGRSLRVAAKTHPPFA